MMPAAYVERVPTFVAVQWDGSDDAASWIASVYDGGVERDGETLLIRDSMDRLEPLEPDYWVVKNDLTGAVAVVDPDTFGFRYRAS